MTLVRLGWRLGFHGGRSVVFRVAAMFVAMALAGAVAAAVLGVPATFAARNSRTAATALRDDPASPVAAFAVEEVVAGRVLTRVVIAGRGVAPPGVVTLPGPGELVWSPSLAALARTDAQVGQRFPQAPVGLIADVGLVAPGELRVYIGVERGASPRFRPTSFGVEPMKNAQGNAMVTVLAGVGVFLALPAAALVATVALLSARAREQRLTTLRLLGLRRRSVRLVNAVEAAVVTALGASVGVTAWARAQQRVGHHGIAGFRWFAADSGVAPLAAALIVTGLVCTAVLIATVAANGAIDQPLRAQRHGARPARTVWRLIALVGGAALLAACAVHNGADNRGLLLLLSGGALCIVGVAVATPLVARGIGFALSGRQGPTALLLSRRLRHEPTAASRTMSGLLVATFAVGAAHGVVSSLRDAIRVEVDQTHRAITTSLPATSVFRLPGLVAAIAWFEPTDGTEPAWIATCAELRTVLDQPLPTCIEGQPNELVLPGQPTTTTANPLDVAWPNGTQTITGLVRPPAHLDSTTIHEWFLRVDPALAENFDTALVRADPASSNASAPELAHIGAMVAALVNTGLAVALTLSLLTIVLATGDRAIERQTLDSNLLALGMPARLIRRTHLLSAAMPMSVAVAVAALSGGLTGHIFRRASTQQLPPQFPSPRFPWSAIAISSAAGLLGALSAGALAYTLARTTIVPDHLRTE